MNSRSLKQIKTHFPTKLKVTDINKVTKIKSGTFEINLQDLREFPVK